MREGNIKVERGKNPVSLDLEEQRIDDELSYPIKLCIESKKNALERADWESQGTTIDKEVINARYVVGCDGANSWVRDKMKVGVRYQGSDSIWGSTTTLRPAQILLTIY